MQSKLQFRGSTLSEVLISLAVMSIGVVSLAALFPISVLRSVQASQLTNATNLRFNAEALLGPLPQLISIGSAWQPAHTYYYGDIVTPTPLSSLKLPPVVFKCTAPTGTTGGQSSSLEPNWAVRDGTTTTDGPLTWTAFALRNYVIDPLGESVVTPGTPPVTLVEPTYRNTASGDFFGNLSGTPATLIRAFSGFSTPQTPLAADSVATLPDSFVTQFESSRFNALTTTSCTLLDAPGTNSIPQIPPAVGVTLSATWRATFFDETGKVSYVRVLTGAGLTALPAPQYTQISWAEALPTGFSPVKIRIDSSSRRYTWMLSVRRGFSGVAYVDAVVFFNRTFSGKEEQIYPATFSSTTDFGSDATPGIAGVDDDANKTTDWTNAAMTNPDPGEIGWPGSDDTPRNWVIVQYPSGDKPSYKKGGFVADVDNLRWYRIIDIREGSAGQTPANLLTSLNLPANALNPGFPTEGLYGAGYTPVFLRLDAPVTQSGGQPASAGAAPTGGAIIMRGVVDVFPLGTHMPWGN